MAAVPKKAPVQPAAWKNRIIGSGEIDPTQLLANPNNAKLHPKRQQEATLAVLRQVGVVQDVIVNVHTNFVVDGHMRVLLAISDNQPTIPVKYVDITEEEEQLVLATFDPLGGLAAYDPEALARLVPGALEASNSPIVVQFFEEMIAKYPPKELPFALPANGANGAHAEADEDEDAEEPAADAALPPLSHVAMVQLFFTAATRDTFLEQVSALQGHWKLDNVTDVVARAVAEAFAAVPEKEVV